MPESEDEAGHLRRSNPGLLQRFLRWMGQPI